MSQQNGEIEKQTAKEKNEEPKAWMKMTWH